MGLMSKLKNAIETDTEKFGKSEIKMTSRTGFAPFDVMNSQKVRDRKGNLHTYSGVNAGNIVEFIGKAGSGKSSIAIQSAFNIIEPYEDGQIYILDFEGSNSLERVVQLSGKSLAYCQDHVILKSTGIYSETFLALVDEISKFKTENYDALLVDNADGITGEDGKIVKILPPTIIIVDSLAAMLPQKYNTTDDNNTDTVPMKTAKVNKGVFQRSIQPLKANGIDIFVVNQIGVNMTTGPMPPTPVTRFLTNTESLPGGVFITYIADTIVKLTAGTKFDPDNEKNPGQYDFKGFEISAVLVKSRLAPAGRMCEMVFSQDHGVDKLFTDFNFLVKYGEIEGKGVYNLKGDAKKVRMKTLRSTYEKDKDFAALFDKRVAELSDRLIVEVQASDAAELEKVAVDSTKKADSADED